MEDRIASPFTGSWVNTRPEFKGVVVHVRISCARGNVYSGRMSLKCTGGEKYLKGYPPIGMKIPGSDTWMIKFLLGASAWHHTTEGAYQFAIGEHNETDIPLAVPVGTKRAQIFYSEVVQKNPFALPMRSDAR